MSRADVPKAQYGEYTELDLIGKGSYGKVFTVRSKADGEVYVLKKVAFDGTPQTEADAALREAHVLSGLRHPHIVPYKEFFKADDGDLCLVMAFCEGGDLYKVIRQLKKAGKDMDELMAWQYLVQMLLSLSYCHSKKILHRDVKTQNIFISNGKLMLGDFGLAKQLQRTLEMARTPIGTPYYMAPEIYEEQPYSFKSDVWALGCVMYEMLTGKPAFGAENLSKVVLRVIRGNYDPLPEQYSEALRGVVGAMLSKSVKKRPDVNELLTHPSVTPHVQAYLDSLSNEAPGGWATWRMKLPPSFMASLALLMEQAQAKAEAAANPAHAASKASAAAAAPAPRVSPRRMDPPAPAPELAPRMALPAFARAALPPISASAVKSGDSSATDPMEHNLVQMVHAKGPVPAGRLHAGATPVAPDFAELQVLQYQIATIGAAAAAPKPRTSPSPGGPRAGHAAAAAAAAASPPPPAVRPRSAAASPASPPPPLKAPLTPPPRKAVHAPGLEVLHASFGFDSLSAMGAGGTPRMPQNMAAAAHLYEAAEDANEISMGQISLYESLGLRAVLLRRELTSQLGPGLLAQACAAIALSHAGPGDGGDAELRKRLVAMLGAKWSEDSLPLLEELQFLESRSKAGK